jgi:hypothetical protein
MKALQPFAQHWTVVLLQEALRNVNDPIGVDAEEIAVVCKVMNRAEREPINDGCNASGVRVFDDMGGLNERGLAERANRASLSVRP